jgi:hypothetical protein
MNISRKLVGLTLSVFSYLTLLADTTDILFIGNSYTYYNNLPSLLSQIALSGGDTIYTQSHTPGGRQISQHANDPVVFNLIRSRDWDYVIIQCQSQEPSFPDGQVASAVLPHAKTLCDSIRANSECTIPMFYMTWGRKNGDASNCAFFPPLCTYQGMDSVLRSNYLKMGDQNNAEVAGVGAVWNRLRSTSTTIELYDADQSHPSYAGSMAGAYTFYTSIFRKSPFEASYKGALSSVDLDSIQAAVKSVIYDDLIYFNLGVNDPKANFSVTQDGCTITCNASDDFDTYLWNFGDGITSAVTKPTHSYNRPGDYTVKLSVSQCGISAMDSVKVNCGTNGINDLEKELSMYPNPTSGIVNIPGYFELIDVRNLLGESISFENKDEASVIILENGVFVLQLRGKAGQLIFKKMVVQ